MPVDSYFATLASRVSGFATGIAVDAVATSTFDVLVFICQRASDGAGLVISRAADPYTDSEILHVSDAALALTGYATAEAYATALAQDGFVKPEYAETVNAHIRHKLTAPYIAALKRGDTGAYRLVRIQGWTFAVATTDYRFTLLERV